MAVYQTANRRHLNFQKIPKKESKGKCCAGEGILDFKEHRR